MKHLGRNVLRDRAIANPANYKRPHAPEVLLVQFREPARVLLRRLDELPLVIFVRAIHESLIKPPDGRKVTVDNRCR